MNPETSLHLAVVKWWAWQCKGFGFDERCLIHVPNGGRRGKVEARILKGMGVRPGVSDLLLAIPFDRGMTYVPRCVPGLWLELKSEDGRLTPEQKSFQALMESLGWAVYIAWSFEEAIGSITAYLQSGDPFRGERRVTANT